MSGLNAGCVFAVRKQGFTVLKWTCWTRESTFSGTNYRMVGLNSSAIKQFENDVFHPMPRSGMSFDLLQGGVAAWDT
jgi:hypothetical protein